MDNNPHRSDNTKPGPPSPGPSRKRSRASSDEEERAIEEKRIKARERQRRKRERDRSGRDKSGGSAMSGTAFPPHDDDPSQQMNVYGPPVEHLANGHGRGRSADLAGLSPEEAAKKERIRTAARERQRKHRASVKAKRMAELGMAIVNAGGGVEQTAVGYVLNEHGQYEPVMEDPNGSHHSHAPHEPPFPVPQPHTTPGQTFASTLLLSFSCAPLLKQHLLRTLHMSDDELASFEPIIAAAWDHWDHEVSRTFVSYFVYSCTFSLSVLYTMQQQLQVQILTIMAHLHRIFHPILRLILILMRTYTPPPIFVRASIDHLLRPFHPVLHPYCVRKAPLSTHPMVPQLQMVAIQTAGIGIGMTPSQTDKMMRIMTTMRGGHHLQRRRVTRSTLHWRPVVLVMCAENARFPHLWSKGVSQTQT